MRQLERERWVSTACYMCYGHCPLRVRVQGGLVVEIVGHPDSRLCAGKACAKGKAAIIGLYDPYRLTRPLKRTNPIKGLGVDPGWQEISWEEALQEICERLKVIREEDPRGLLVLGYDFQLPQYWCVFPSAFGTPNAVVGPANYYCGPALHLVHYLTKGAFYAECDLDFCNYTILMGTGQGFMVSHDALILARKMAEARERGMHLVVVDPMAGVAGSKADEWVPIRPGTDGALALAMINVLVNDLGIYDTDFIKKYTNGSYLVGEDGHYLRDQASGKPLVWDGREGQARAYDLVPEGDCGLEGTFAINGTVGWPAFQCLKDHVKKYSPEKVSEITDVPAETIRRLAREFGEAARIGSRIVIDGVELPFRPAVVAWNRGVSAHKHAGLSTLAIELLNILVGNVDMPGGWLGNRTLTPLGGPEEGPDGLLVPGLDCRLHGLTPYPARKVTEPETITMGSFFPTGLGQASPMFEEGVLYPEKYGLPFRIKAAIIINSNVMMTASRRERMAEVLKKIPFIVSLSLYANETVEFADVVLPDAHFLERFVPFPNSHTVGYALASRCWYWPFQQPVVMRMGDVKSWPEVLGQIAEGVGIQEDYNRMLNQILNLKGDYRLFPSRRYSWEEIVDNWAKSWYGADHDLDWFKGEGLFTAKKSVQEMYPRPFFKPRIPIYYEHFINAGKEVRDLTEQMGLSWDTADYQPLPDWRPCPAYAKDEEYDLVAINYRLPFHTFSTTVQNPWLNEVAEHNPYAYKVLIHTQAARAKGLKDGDAVWVESRVGREKGLLKVTECIHPEVVAIAGAFGHWAARMPVAEGKGIHFNSLLPGGLEGMDTFGAAMDQCVRVKVSKA